MLHRPHLPGAVEAHLDLVVDEQDAVLFAERGKPPEVAFRRNHVAAGALHRLDEERAELRAPGLRIPRPGVFVLEQALEFGDARVLGLLGVAAVRRAERIGERNELRAVGKLAEGLAVAVRRGDRRRAERAAVVAALERQHPLPAGDLAHELQGVLDRLRAPDIELHPALHAEGALDALADQLRQLDFLPMQVLAGELRQPIHLGAHCPAHRRVGVAQVDRGVPHLQVEVLPAVQVVEVAALASLEELRLFGVVDRVAVRAEAVLLRQQRQFLVRNPGRRFGKRPVHL